MAGGGHSFRDGLKDPKRRKRKRKGEGEGKERVLLHIRERKQNICRSSCWCDSSHDGQWRVVDAVGRSAVVFVGDGETMRSNSVHVMTNKPKRKMGKRIP